MRLTVNQQKELIPDDSVKAAFMNRADIAALPEEERKTRWADCQKSLDKFRGFLSTRDSITARAP